MIKMKNAILVLTILFASVSSFAAISYDTSPKNTPDFTNKRIDGTVLVVSYTSTKEAGKCVAVTIQLDAKLYGTSSIDIDFTGSDLQEGMAVAGAVGKHFSAVIGNAVGGNSADAEIDVENIR